MVVKKEIVNKKNFEKLLLKSAKEALQMVRKKTPAKPQRKKSRK